MCHVFVFWFFSLYKCIYSFFWSVYNLLVFITVQFFYDFTYISMRMNDIFQRRIWETIGISMMKRFAIELAAKSR